MTIKKTLAIYGPKRASVRVFTEDALNLVRVQWREAGAVRTKSWPNTPTGRTEAKAWARGFSESRDQVGRAVPVRITLRALWAAFCEAEFPHLRPNTQRLYNDGWRRWEDMWGKGFIAEDATPQMLDQFRRESEDRARLAVNTVRMAIRSIKTAYAFGERRELIGRNRLATWRYKLAKDKRPTSPAEFTADEFAGVLSKLDPTSRSQWRAHVALALCGYQGVRQHAALHLQWDDVDFEAGRIIWRAAWDKVGREWSQPMREPTRVALEHARAHRKDGNRWVLPASLKDDCYSKQSLWWSLKRAEKAAGVVHRARRGAHGFRRMLAGDVMAMTSNPLEGLRAIGDRDLRMAEPYLQEREGVTADVFAKLDVSHRNQTAIRENQAADLIAAKAANTKPDNDL